MSHELLMSYDLLIKLWIINKFVLFGSTFCYLTMFSWIIDESCISNEVWIINDSCIINESYIINDPYTFINYLWPN